MVGEFVQRVTCEREEIRPRLPIGAISVTQQLDLWPGRALRNPRLLPFFPAADTPRDRSRGDPVCAAPRASTMAASSNPPLTAAAAPVRAAPGARPPWVGVDGNGPDRIEE